eukprot:TRINITY_DN13431_c0_g1_i1.p1 TRINITY_DN13431_c0_g1~~TRINITY_DN13431_c0_g1_i1.p1  ORF type:complete len:124 (-),score=37.04 TRINITY_DN13431_c0_g1_i1:224-595(-)
MREANAKLNGDFKDKSEEANRLAKLVKEEQDKYTQQIKELGVKLSKTTKLFIEEKQKRNAALLTNSQASKLDKGNEKLIKEHKSMQEKVATLEQRNAELMAELKVEKENNKLLNKELLNIKTH